MYILNIVFLLRAFVSLVAEKGQNGQIYFREPTLMLVSGLTLDLTLGRPLD